MSNYPPTPSFGGAFTFGTHWPPPPLPSNTQPAPPPNHIQRSDAQTHHQQNQQQHNPAIPPPVFPPLPSQDFQGFLNANASSFTANAQLREYLKEHYPVPPPHFPYPAPFASTSFPPPPFPPVPIPIPGLPSGFNHQHPLPLQNQTPSITQPTDPVNRAEQSEYLVADALSTESASVAEHTAGEDADREEGELSEEEFAVRVNSPVSGRASLVMGQTCRKVKADDNGDPPTKDPYDRDNMNITPQDLPQSQNARQYQNGTALSNPFSKPTPEYSQPSLAPSQMPTMGQPSQPLTDQPSRDSISVEKHVASQHHFVAMNPTQLKKQATGALFNLLPHNIKYDDLVREGVDPVVLRRLYADIGVKVVTSSPPPSSNPENSAPSILESTETAASQAATSVPMNATMPTALSTGTAQDPQDSATAGPKAALGQPEIQIAHNMPPMTNSSSSGTLVSKASDGKPPPRNEYIARMLAAKTGKTGASVGQLESPVASAINPAASSSPPVQIAIEERDSSKVAGDTKGKEKSRAKTELARQRMEQLKEQVRLSKVALQPAGVDGSSTSATGLSVPPSLSNVDSRVDPITQSRSSPIAVEPTILEASAHSTPQNSLRGVPDLGRPTPPQIPGLFMTEPQRSSPVTHATAQLTLPSFQTQSVQQTPSRKRPVASDLIDESPHVPARPFGQSRDSLVVIDISDEEIDYSQGDSDMDMDGGVNVEKPDRPSSSRGTATHQAIRDLPPLTDFPGRQPFSIPSNPVTPLIVSARQTPARGRDFDDLLQKNQQIEEMKRRIREMESRRKPKQSSSRTPQTPGTPSLQQPQQIETLGPLGVRQTETVYTSAITEALAIRTPPPVANLEENREQQLEVRNAVSNPPDAIQLAAELEQSSCEQDESPIALPDIPHAPQQAALTDSRETPIDLTATPSSPGPRPARLNAQELELKRKRKAEIESGLPVLDAEVERTRSKLDQMRRDMEQMEDQIRRGLQGRRDLVLELEALGIDTEGVPTDELQAKMDQIVEEQNLAQIKSAGFEPTEPSSVEETNLFEDDVVSLPNDGLANTHEFCPEEVSVEEAEDQEAMHTSDHFSSPQQPPEVIHVLSSDSGLEEGELDSNGVSLREEQQNEAEMYSDGDDSAMSLDDSVQDESSELEAESSFVENDTSASHAPPQSLHVRDADSEEASPQSPAAELGETENAEVINRGHEPDASESIEESDGDLYEPPEPVPATVDDRTTDTPPFSPAPPETSISGPDISMSTSGLRVLDDGQAEPPRASNALEQGHRLLSPTEVLNQSGRFTPYESPLRQFHSYRFHPDYTSNVEGGYASTTYSNRIDLKNPVCVYESSGGICNDTTCDSQHFRQMHLSGDMVLAQLGGIREGTTLEERQQYIDGLKTIIADMRRDKVKDLNTIADEIAKYRRQFLQDPSRVLAL